MIALGKSANLLTPGTHGTTFGGSPVACAAANATVDFLKRENILKQNVVKGDFIKTEISTVPGVGEVRGQGLLIGIVLNNPIAKKVATELLDLGFIVNPANDHVIRLAPPLVITNEQISEFIKAFTKVVSTHG